MRVQSSRPQTLQELSCLSSDEEKLKSDLINVLTKEKPESQVYKRTLECLGRYPARVLFVLSANSPEIYHVLDNDASLASAWSVRLKKLKLPEQAIHSFDQMKIVTPFTQIIGDYLMHLYEKHEEMSPLALTILDKACQLGIYSALIKRMNLFSEKLRRTKPDNSNDTEMRSLTNTILDDAAAISNLYWSIGGIDSALILFAVANRYFDIEPQKLLVERFFMPASRNKFSWLSMYDADSCPYPVVLIEAAIENLYFAQLVVAFPESVKAVDGISHGKGMLAGFESHFQNRDELQKHVFTLLDNLHFPLIESFCRNAYGHAVKKIQSRYPEFNPEANLKLI